MPTQTVPRLHKSLAQRGLCNAAGSGMAGPVQVPGIFLFFLRLKKRAASPQKNRSDQQIYTYLCVDLFYGVRGAGVRAEDGTGGGL